MTVEYISKFVVFDFEWITTVKERGIANKQKNRDKSMYI